MIIFFSIIMLLFPLSHYAQINFSSINNRVNLSFVKQNFQGDEAIEVQFSIRNIGSSESEFILSDILNQSIHFELKTSRNELVSYHARSQASVVGYFSNPALYRRITLLPGESFSRVFDLRDLYDLYTHETFYVKGIFYPDPDDRTQFVSSDLAYFTQVPPLLVQQYIVSDSIQRAQEIRALTKLSVDEVIGSFFEAQMEKDWEKFLLHIDSDRLIQSFQNYAVLYNGATDGVFKLELIERFKRFFTTHWDIPIIGYMVNEIVMRGDTATVEVDATESIHFTSRRIRYTFTLFRNTGGTWLITDYAVLMIN